MISRFIEKANTILDRVNLIMIDCINNGLNLYVKYMKTAYIVYMCKQSLLFHEKFNTLTPETIERNKMMINEFYKITLNRAPINLNPDDGGGATTTEWKSYRITILNNGQTNIPGLPFNVSDIDTDSLFFTVDGDDPVYGEANDYHIEATTLLWHSFYDLKTDMKALIKWRE